MASCELHQLERCCVVDRSMMIAGAAFIIGAIFQAATKNTLATLFIGGSRLVTNLYVAPPQMFPCLPAFADEGSRAQ